MNCLRESDIVVLACPLTDRNARHDRRAQLALMKRGAAPHQCRARRLLSSRTISSPRSKAGHLGGAALDVFAEQPLPPDHPLFGFDNVILTPHLAGITEEAMERMGAVVAEETIRILNGDLPVNLVNPEAVPAYRKRFPA